MGQTTFPAPITSGSPLNTSTLFDGVLATAATATKTVTVPVGAHQFIASDRLCVYTPKGYEIGAVTPMQPVFLNVTSADTALTVSKVSDALNFAASALTNSVVWTGLAYGAGLFVAISSTSGNFVNTSPDGITWTSRSLPASAAYNGIAWNPIIGLFIAFVSGGNYITSPDGINWTARTSPTSVNQLSSAGDKFFFTLSSTAVWYSKDGINWTSTTVTGLTQVTKVTFGNNAYICTQAAAGTTVNVSIDGIIWVASTITGATSQTFNVIFLNGLFYCYGSTGLCWTSPDGVVWTTSIVTINIGALGIPIVGNGIALCGSTTGVYYSLDGKVWNLKPYSTVTTGIVQTIAIGKGTIVVTNQSPASTVANYSVPITPRSPISFGIYAAPVTVI